MPDTLSPPSGIGPAAPKGLAARIVGRDLLAGRDLPVDRRASARAGRARGHHDRHGRGACSRSSRPRSARTPRLDQQMRVDGIVPDQSAGRVLRPDGSSRRRWRAISRPAAILVSGPAGLLRSSPASCCSSSTSSSGATPRSSRRSPSSRIRRSSCASAALHPAAELRARNDGECDDAGGVPADARRDQLFGAVPRLDRPVPDLVARQPRNRRRRAVQAEERSDCLDAARRVCRVRTRGRRRR